MSKHSNNAPNTNANDITNNNRENPLQSKGPNRSH